MQEYEVVCPDCGGRTHLMEGRWGRFYRCDHYLCQGTVGARLDGTPRPEKGTPDELAARHRTRDIIHCTIQAISVEQGDFIYFRGTVDPFKEIVEMAEVAPDPGAQIVHWKGFDGEVRSACIQRVKPSIHLKKRSIEDCRKIERAAVELRRKICPNAWDRIALGFLEGDVEGTQS